MSQLLEIREDDRYERLLDGAQEAELTGPQR
jgi:hypothetical protein